MAEIRQIDAKKLCHMTGGIRREFVRKWLRTHDRILFVVKLEFPGHGKWFIKEQGLYICLTVGKCEEHIIKLEICETYKG